MRISSFLSAVEIAKKSKAATEDILRLSKNKKQMVEGEQTEIY